MKVIHGMSEVAGQGIYSVQGLQANGIQANMAVWSRNPSKYPLDIDLKIDKNNRKKIPVYAIKMGLFALKAFFKYDVMHSHYGYSLLPFSLDTPFWAAANKKLFVEFHGSDIRGIFEDINYKYYKQESITKVAKQKLQKRIIKLLKHADGVILHDLELRDHLPNLNVPLYTVPLRVDLSEFSPVYPPKQKEKPIIVHAPSRRSGKGTEKILEALNKIGVDFELILVEGKPHDEAIEIYKKADIIIDQISVGTYGVFAIEAMALGKPVITYISDEIQKTMPKELPIVSADFDTLPQVISQLVEDGEKRYELGLAGRQYAERFHDNKRVASYLAKIYDGTIEDTDLFKLL